METITTREYTHDVERVFDTLRNILDKYYNIKDIDKTIRCIKASSEISSFSWGETFEVIVVAQNSGSVVRVRTKSRIPWDVTNNVEEKAKKLLNLLEESLD